MFCKFISINIAIISYCIFINYLSAACPNMATVTGAQIYSLLSGNAEQLGDRSYKLKDAKSVSDWIEMILVSKMKDVRDWANSGEKFFGHPMDPAKLAVSQMIPAQGPYLAAMGPKYVIQQLKLLTMQYTQLKTKKAIEGACTFNVRVLVSGYAISFNQIITLVPAS